MTATAPKENHYFRAASIFVVCLVAVFGLPYFAVYAHSILPNALTNLLFFSPQQLFPYGGFVTRDPSGIHSVFSDGVARTLNFVHWGLMTAAFAWLARRVPMRFLILAAIAAIVLVDIATLLAFGAFGIHVMLDGP